MKNLFLTIWQLFQLRVDKFSSLYLKVIMLVLYDSAYTGRSTSTIASNGAI